ncbi:MAG: hypothetical protein CMP61_08575 [Flavobacteriales bacterium]|nr:hypothetical protein [Flavobacteriales bacterium]|tara:strand:- start:6704 stop:7672 length:969 start_codon:yes stop_codon:yes gene_type:complete
MITDYESLLSNQGKRILEIHSLLKYRGYDYKRLIELIKERTNRSYSERTFKKDIEFMRKELSAPINASNRGEYSYNKNFSLFQEIGLLDHDVEVLENLASAASKYESLPFFRDLKFLTQKLNRKHNEKEIVCFEGAPVEYKGVDLFEDIFWSIKENRSLEIEYTPFEGPKHITKINPYYLKEYRYRWYVYGWNIKLKNWRVYALDRLKIKNQSPENDFTPIKEFDPMTRWKHSVGIIALNSKPIEFSFELKNGKRHNNIDYIKSMPIHRSQTLIQPKDGSEYYKVKLVVHPTIELFREIRRFGHNNIKNIYPKKFEDDIFEN